MNTAGHMTPQNFAERVSVRERAYLLRGLLAAAGGSAAAAASDTAAPLVSAAGSGLVVAASTALRSKTCAGVPRRQDFIAALATAVVHQSFQPEDPHCRPEASHPGAELNGHRDG